MRKIVSAFAIIVTIGAATVSPAAAWEDEGAEIGGAILGNFLGGLASQSYGYRQPYYSAPNYAYEQPYYSAPSYSYEQPYYAAPSYSYQQPYAHRYVRRRPCHLVYDTWGRAYRQCR